ncbi:MAG: sugar ABC transporter ATP-binding protein [Phycisphaeraceae bacterium]|nr:sugar ABC transporter ATP-binding protein [Phycisphaeraceae bacterium]
MSDLLVVRNITKRFGPTVALDDVSASFRAGEVHALMGENGAGKSTLGKVIAGLHRPDDGTVMIGGRSLRPGSIDEAFRAGVRIVHQELAQCPNLSVAENLCLHDLPTGRLGLVDRRAMNARAERLLLRLEPAIDVEAPLGSLPPGHRQIVQIASSLDDRTGGPAAGGGDGKTAESARVIVFDEPTSSLAIAEVDRLLKIVRQLAREGITILYVSHRMAEIFEVCDRVTVLRDGRYVATSDVGSLDEATLVEQMIGRRIEMPVRRGGADSGADPDRAAGRAMLGPAADGHTPGQSPPLLEVRRIQSRGKLHGVSLDVRAGEIVGVGGLVGAGRSELLDAVFGLDHAARGTVRVAGQEIDLASPRSAIRAGVGYVPEDRKLQGLFFELGADENITMPVMGRLAHALGFRSLSAERVHVADRLEALRVKAASPRSRPGELSGGNQQKLLIARWMGKGTRVLLLDEPTRGIDVGTKIEIYRLVRQAAEEGAAILLVSSEMPELLALSDRIVVLCDGRLTGELRGEDMTQANILRLATMEQPRGTAAR